MSVGRTDKTLCPVSAVLTRPGAALSVSRWQISHTGKVGDGGEGSYLSSGSGQLTVLGAQLPERRSNYSCQAGDCRGDDPKVRPMEEQRLPDVHKDAKTRAGGSVSGYGMGYKPVRDHKLRRGVGHKGGSLGGLGLGLVRKEGRHLQPPVHPTPHLPFSTEGERDNVWILESINVNPK